MIPLLVASCGQSPASDGAHAIPEPSSTEGFDAELSAFLQETRDDLRAELDDPQRWVRLGMAYEAHSMFELALPCYERAVELDDSQAKWWYRLALGRTQEGDLAGALEAVSRTIALESGYAAAHARRGGWLLELGELKPAVQSFERALAIDGRNPAATLGLAQVHLARGEHADVLTRLDDPELLAGPGGPLAHELRGQALARLGRDDEAAVELAQGGPARRLSADPWSREVRELRRGTAVRLLRATRLLMRGKAQAALEVLEEGRRHAPRDPRVLRKLGTAYAELERPAQALAVLREAVDVAPEDPLLRVSLAGALAMGNDLQAALEALDQALALDGRCTWAYESKAQMLLAAGRCGEVAEVHAAGSGQGVRTPGLAVAAGKALVELESFGEALEHFSFAAHGDPTSVDAWIGLALAHAHFGQREEGLRALERARTLDADHAMLPVLRAALDEAGDPDGDG